MRSKKLTLHTLQEVNIEYCNQANAFIPLITLSRACLVMDVSYQYGSVASCEANT